MTTEADRLPRLATVPNTAKAYAEAGQTVPTIRRHIRDANENGLAASGAICRRGRRVLIDLPLYGAWLAGR
jgi:hypothetical protein